MSRTSRDQESAATRLFRAKGPAFMLQDRYRQLLTAYVDGELTSRQHRQVARLLSRSPEARQLLRQLKADALALRQLPQPALQADLTPSVLRSIAERGLTPGQRRIFAPSSTRSWIGPVASWAAAASILFVLGTASYLYFVASLTRPAQTEMAKYEPGPNDPVSQPEQLDPPPAKVAAPQKAPLLHPQSKIDGGAVVKRSDRSPKRDGKTVAKVPTPPSSQPKEETALTDRLEMFQLESVRDILPVVLKISDLGRDSERKKLIAELRKDRDFRMELPCQNGTKAFERVQKAARSLHFGLVLDKQAQERIKLKWRTNYVLYLENVTPEELTHFVQQIGAEDRKIAAGKSADRRIDRLVLTRMTAQHRKELSTLLGVDPTTTPPRANGPLGADVSKPLSDQTASQVAKALAGQGGPQRADAAKPSAKPPEHVILVLPYNPVRPAPGSDEIKRFLDQRKPARPGTIRVLLVLRG